MKPQRTKHRGANSLVADFSRPGVSFPRSELFWLEAHSVNEAAAQLYATSMRSFFIFVLAAAFLRKQPKFEETGPIETKAHESVSAEDTIKNAESISFGTPEEACSYCYQESFMKGIFLCSSNFFSNFWLISNFWQTLRGPFSAVSTPNFASK